MNCAADGVLPTMTRRSDNPRAPYDAVIVGGGPAGLSAALVLGRARRRVLVVDDGRPANAASQGVGGLLGQDRVKPSELRERGRRQLREHPNVEFLDCAIEDAELAMADSYEPMGYRRVPARFASGREGWVYAASDTGLQ